MFCIKELKLLYAAVVLLLEAELLVNIEAMESRSSSLLTQNPDDLKSLELCTNRNQQRLGSVYGNFTRHHKKGHRRRTTSTTPATSIYTTTDVNDVTEVYSTTEVRIEEHPKLPKPLRLTARLEDYDVNIDSILDDELRELMPRHPNSRRIDNKEFIQELSDVSLAKSLSKIKKIHRDTSSSLSNKLSGKSNKNGIFLTENCTTVVAQIGTTAILHCEVSDITENTVTWIRRKDYSLLSVGLVTYSADSRFFSAHGRHVKGAWNLNFRHRYSAGWGLLTSKTINAIIQSQWLKTSEPLALFLGEHVNPLILNLVISLVTMIVMRADIYVSRTEVFEEMRKNNRQCRFILHHDNSSCHTPAGTTGFLESQKIVLTGHALYSPDLAPNNFYILPSVKNKLPDQRFMSREEAVDGFKIRVLEIPHSESKKCLKNCFQRMQSASINLANILKNHI
ncbi:Mariner Mos1 transposase [Eumeta japonica]|uniref:Mariner Mos1 transposase n=1 Tax=Eumeta variegata TaxID=151549 RepID=A0A4C1ZV26_EUMVA|nr:Mariner Mos1 transposase [Eumeta japonica]